MNESGQSSESGTPDELGSSGPESPDRYSREVDARGLSAGEVKELLQRAELESHLKLVGLSESMAGVGAGLDRPIELLVAGGVGPFAWMLCQKAKIEIGQNASIACGHSLHSGSMLIHGDCADYLAAYAMGGFVAVHGKAGDNAAFELAGGEVVIRSRCGSGAGTRMRSGALVLGNGAGDGLGLMMTGGTIYVRGPIASLAKGVQAVPVKDSDSLRLGLLLARAGLRAKLTEFQAIRPIHQPGSLAAQSQARGPTPGKTPP